MNESEKLKLLRAELETASAPVDGKWVFDEKVAKIFETMLELSIPGYKDMRDVLFRIGRNALRESDGAGKLLDLGASSGEGSARFIETFPATQFKLCDISEPMLERMRERFLINTNVNVEHLDLRSRFSELVKKMSLHGESDYDVILATLTLIFVPLNHRMNIKRAVFESLRPGGVFLLTEKLTGNTYATDNLLVDLYHALKHDNGYSLDAIERKRLSLEHVQTCKTQYENETDLRNVGFSHVECVHRFLNFGTFVAIK